MSERTWIFVGIGVAGFAVQLSALNVLTGTFGIASAGATAAAVELAVLHNFVWHERWTWADRTTADRGGTWRRLLLFHASNGVVSLVGNVGLTTVISGTTGLPVLPANVLAVGACTAINFLAADRMVFPPAQGADR